MSQGTVRKALDTLAAEKLVERRQGKGTYVSEHTQERTLFRFFRLARPDGERVTPQSRSETVKRRAPKRSEKSKLRLGDGEQVLEIKRVRLIDDMPAIVETVIIPLALFADIDQHGDLPNTLYSLYQSTYGVSVVAAEESLKAVTATKDDAKRLSIPAGTPLLQIDRVAVALDGKHVELRKSRCDTSNLVYAVVVK